MLPDFADAVFALATAGSRSCREDHDPSQTGCNWPVGWPVAREVWARLAAPDSPFPIRCPPCYHSLDREQGRARMTAESVGGILGAIVAAVVLAVAIVFGPIGQYGKPAKPAKPATAEQPTAMAPAPAAPAPRGP